MSKMSQISSEMDEQNVPTEERNSLLSRVSAGMHAAEKAIDCAKPTEKAKQQVKADWRVLVAKRIKEFAITTHNVITLDGKSYVKVGVYQYLASLLNLTPEYDFNDGFITDNGKITEDKESPTSMLFVRCKCKISDKEGKQVTNSLMFATQEEDFLKDKPAYAVYGTAQTRAFTRAMKNAYGYIIEMAGFQSVGAEEIE